MAFLKPEGGTREARPTDFPPFFQTNSEFLARWRAPVFRRGGGSKSEAILYIVLFYGGIVLIGWIFSAISNVFKKQREKIRDQVATERKVWEVYGLHKISQM